MKKTAVYMLLAAFIMLMASCKKDETTNEYKAKAVVEAYLLAGQIIRVYITKEILCISTADTAEALDALTVKIIHNDNTYILTAKGSGNYVSDSTLIVTEGDTYKLEFEYDNNIISSSTTIPSKPTGLTASATSITVEAFDPTGGTLPSFPDPIELTWNNMDNNYFLIVVQNVETSLDPINDTINDRPPAFRNEPAQISSYNIMPMSFIYYGTHHILLYKLNPEYALLYNDNGNNSQNLTTPVSNITNGLGIFTGINADSVIVEVTQ